MEHHCGPVTAATWCLSVPSFTRTVNVTVFSPYKNGSKVVVLLCQGGHGTGKTGNLVLTFSSQGKHREFCFDTGKNFETQGKYFSVTQGKI